MCPTETDPKAPKGTEMSIGPMLGFRYTFTSVDMPTSLVLQDAGTAALGSAIAKRASMPSFIVTVHNVVQCLECIRRTRKQTNAQNTVLRSHRRPKQNNVVDTRHLKNPSQKQKQQRFKKITHRTGWHTNKHARIHTHARSLSLLRDSPTWHKSLHGYCKNGLNGKPERAAVCQ